MTPLPPNSIARTLLVVLTAASAVLVGRASSLEPGRPIMESLSTRDLGMDATCWSAAQDGMGRLLVGGDGLMVFNGSEWRKFPIPGSYCLRAIEADPAGRVWVGAVNELGYFSPTRLGGYSYHSLVGFLPANSGPVGDVWKIFVDGGRIVFVTQDRVLTWTGHSFEICNLPGGRRLFASRSGGKIFVDCLPRGLYRMEEGKLRLIISAALLGDHAAVIGVEVKGDDDYSLATSEGFFRFHRGALEPIDPEASAYVKQNRLTAVVRLPDQTLVAGTLQGGIALISDSGRLVRTISTAAGLPSRAVYSLFYDREGGLWVTSVNYLARIDFNIGITSFDSSNGLTGKPCLSLFGSGSAMTVCTEDGLFQLESPDSPAARFAPNPNIRARYWTLAGSGGRTFAAGLRGIDELTGGVPRELIQTDRDVFCLKVAPENPRILWEADGSNVGYVVLAPGERPAKSTVAALPDSASSLAVSPDGSVWAATRTLGLFRIEVGPKGVFKAAHIPLLPDGAENKGSALVVRFGSSVVAFVGNRAYILKAGPWGANLERIPSFPAAEALAAAPSPQGDGLFVAVARDRSDGTQSAGLGELLDPAKGDIRWQDIDLPGLSGIGRVHAMAFVDSPASPVLWIGGAEGVVRVEPGRLSVLGLPPRPVVDFLAPSKEGPAPVQSLGVWIFQHSQSKFSFHFSALDFRHRQQLLYQARLLGQSSEWGVPSTQPAREFSFLREGNYEFQVRTVGPSGLLSDPVSLRFRVLPPWFRSPWALLAACAILAATVAAVFKWRHRAVIAQNRELERIVHARTLELERTNAAKDEFVASISHEIRNPLNGVIGLAFALDGTDLNPGQRNQLSMMRQCADHLSSLIEDILDFSRINAGEIEIEPKPFEVQELLDSARSVVYEQSINARIPIDLSIDESVPPVLIGDEHRIRQVLLNYIGNALNYAGSGRVTVSARSIPLTPPFHEVVFTVSDQGPGIPLAEQAKLFTKFKRGAAARSTNVRGAGLGLAVCRLLAERMGGTATVESELGRGASFNLSLALAQPALEVIAPAVPAEVSFATAASALVVEDQEFNSAGLVAMLQRMGVVAEVVTSGEEALRQLGAKRYSLVLADCDLPGMNGLELASSIRRREGPGEHIPIIATTAYATRQIVEECSTAGMDDFVGKPITVEKLRAAVARVLDRRRAAPPVRFAAVAGPPSAPYRLDTLRYIAGENAPEFERRLRSYIQELDRYVNEVGAAAGTADFARLCRIAHLLVGHLSVVQHAALSLLAQQIEESAVNRDLPEINAKLTEFHAGVRVLKRQMLAEAENVQSG